MALSLNANWVAAMGKGKVELRHLVTLGTGAASSVKFLDHPCDQFRYPLSIASITANARKLDVFTRRMQVSQVTVRLHLDTLVRSTLIATRLLGKKVAIEIGERTLAEGDFENLMPLGVVAKVRTDENTLELVVKDNLHIVNRAEIVGTWRNEHPSEAILDIMQESGLVAAQYTAADFDYDADTSISHYVVGRAGLSGSWIDYGINEPTNALDLISNLAQLMDATVHPDETGTIRLTKFDSSASSAADWTEDDIRDLKVIDLNAHFVNRILCKSHSNFANISGMPNDGGYMAGYERNDTDSQSNYAWGAASERIETKQFNCDFVTGFTRLSAAWTAGSPAAAGTFTTFQDLPFQMCGTRQPSFPTAQPANAKLSGSRLAYLKIDEEIVTCDLAVADTTSPLVYHFYDPRDGSTSQVNVPGEIVWTLNERDALGTTAAAHAIHTPIFDITIPVNMAVDRLTRWADGAALIEVHTDYRQYAVQVTDLVTLTTSRFVGFGDDGLSTTTKWEVIGKELIRGEKPSIKWTLAWATKTGASAGTSTSRTWKGITNWLDQSLVTEEEAATDKHVVSGFGMVDEGGLEMTLESGVVSGEGIRQSMPNDYFFELEASKETYIYYNLYSNAIAIRAEAATGDYEQAGDVPLWHVTTDGSDITATSDLRVTTALAGGKVHVETIKTDQTAKDSVGRNHNFDFGMYDGTP